MKCQNCGAHIARKKLFRYLHSTVATCSACGHKHGLSYMARLLIYVPVIFIFVASSIGDSMPTLLAGLVLAVCLGLVEMLVYCLLMKWQE